MACCALPKTVVAYPGNGLFAQQVARAFHETGRLHRFATTFVYDPEARWARAVTALPGALGRRCAEALGRRCVTAVALPQIAIRPWWELGRSAAVALGANPPIVDWIWDRMARDFTRQVARRHVPACGAVYAYEYTALEAFETAKAHHKPCMLDLPSLSSREFEALLQRERAAFPELTTPYDGYFSELFEERQARREQEIALADILVTNSRLTARSHVAYGADPSRVVTLPLAAPPAIGRVEVARPVNGGPLKVIWAGTFGIGKGAHYFLEAWRTLQPAPEAEAWVYGRLGLPQRCIEPRPRGIAFCGSVPQSELFQRFQQADALVFPTLSDGFGMVVNEAFSQGLPVITTDRAGAADLVRHRENGLVIRAGDPHAIAAALRWCLEHRQELAAMRHAALETAQGWQWPDYRRALIQRLEAALERAGFEPTVAASH